MPLMHAVQKNGTVLLVSRGNPTGDGPVKLHRVRQSVIIPAHFFEAEECWLGDRRVKDFTAESETAQPVFVHLGRAYLALYPLALTDHGRSAAVRLEKVNRYQVVSSVNYEGDEKAFTADELARIKAFYDTPLGHKIIDAEGEINAQIKADTREVFNQRLEEFIERADAVLGAEFGVTSHLGDGS